MVNTIPIEGELWEKLCLKSYNYGFDSLIILKCVGLEIYSMWFPDLIKHEGMLNWIEKCKTVQRDYANETSIVKENFKFSLLSKESGIDILFETTNIPDKAYKGIVESVLQMIKYLINNTWDEKYYDFIPTYQKKTREEVNNTHLDLEMKCLHKQFYENVLKNPNSTALKWDESGQIKVMSYKELSDNSLKVANMLIQSGVKKDDLVSVILPKGIDQIIAVLGIHSAGAAYVPISIMQPLERKKKILYRSNVKFLLTNKDKKAELLDKEGLSIIDIQSRNKHDPLEFPIFSNVDSTAYVIFTSGTTGEPKGVVISHKSAYNSIADINRKFEVTQNDCAIGISELDFDLSVYDIFGLLSAGGSIFVLNERDKKEATVWMTLISENNVTVWNTVPAIFDMLLTVSEKDRNILPLKKIFLSGDWVKKELYLRCKKVTKKCRFISLGGATEASIWSNYFEVDSSKDINDIVPYGIPLSNQRLRVVDINRRDCPDYVCGELWIGGSGIALGYLHNDELTKEKFIFENNVLWYKTGDLARYNENGIIEFLGRIDTQVKLNGFRIELGEIENIINKYDGIKEVVATFANIKDTKHIVASIVPDLYSNKKQVMKHQILLEQNINFKNVELNKRIEAVERFLVKICSFDNLITEVEYKINDDEINTVLKIWIKWLDSRDVINVKGDKILPGKRYKDVLDNESVEKSDIGKILFTYIDMIKKIITGFEKPTILMEYEDLLPETLSIKGFETQYYIEQINNTIKDFVTLQGHTAKVAILGSRTGLAAEKILEKLGDKIEITLFDESTGMLDRAKMRFAGYSGVINFEVIQEGYVDKKHLYAYDFVIAVNSLHQYKNPLYGVLIASTLLKNSGNLLAIEYEDLDPVAIVISSLLEDGFSDFTIGRSRNNNPLLTKKEWLEVFSNSNFQDVVISTIESTSVEYISGKIINQNNILSENKFREYLERELPYYMMPKSIEIFSWIPLSKNGKVDRDKITKILSRNVLEENNEAIYEGFEKEVACIWIELFNFRYIARDTSFFEIGGDSLLATRFIAEIKQIYNIDLSLREMFDNPKLYQVAEIISEKIQYVSLMVEGEI